MKCERIEELLSPYLEDELDPEERRAVESHLRTCQNCAILLSFMKKTRESLAGFPELELSDGLLDRLYTIPEKKRRFRINLDFFLQPTLQPVLAAATILLMVISFYLFNPNRENINNSVNRQVHLGYSKIEKLYAKAESFTDNLGAYKDNVLVSLKKINPFGGNED
jgi:hypothetical protein